MAGEAIAVVSVASGATVAVAVPYINAHHERAKLRFQTQASRLDELRSRLDDSMGALSLAESAVESAVLSVERAQHTAASESACDAATGAIEKLREAADRVDTDRQLLAVRLGAGSGVVAAYDSARVAVRDIQRELGHILETGPEWSDPADYDEPAKQLAHLRQRYERGKEQFLDAAASVVGPDAGKSKKPVAQGLVRRMSGGGSDTTTDVSDRPRTGDRDKRIDRTSKRVQKALGVVMVGALVGALLRRYAGGQVIHATAVIGAGVVVLTALVNTDLELQGTDSARLLTLLTASIAAAVPIAAGLLRYPSDKVTGLIVGLVVAGGYQWVSGVEARREPVVDDQ